MFEKHSLQKVPSDGHMWLSYKGIVGMLILTNYYTSQLPAEFKFSY